MNEIVLMVREDENNRGTECWQRRQRFALIFHTWEGQVAHAQDLNRRRQRSGAGYRNRKKNEG